MKARPSYTPCANQMIYLQMFAAIWPMFAMICGGEPKALARHQFS